MSHKRSIINIHQVNSGDSLVIRAISNAVPAPERNVSLAHVTAPRLALPGGKDKAASTDEVM